MATTIILVRHAAHPLLGKVLCGRMPGVALDNVGHHQATRLAAILAAECPTALHVSPMERAVQTAAAIADACCLRAQVSEALNEIDFGRWTSTPFMDLLDDPAWSRWNTERAEACPPGGEPMKQAQARVVSGLHDMCRAQPNGTIIAVSHADVIKAALLWCLGLTLDAYMRFDIDPASTSAIALGEGGDKVLWMNRGVTA